MLPEIRIHYLAVVVAALAAFFFRLAWHGPLFGKTWAAPGGLQADQQADDAGHDPGAGGVAPHRLRPGAQRGGLAPVGLEGGPDQRAAAYDFFAGLFTWLGFYVPMLFGAVAWEGKSC